MDKSADKLSGKVRTRREKAAKDRTIVSKGAKAGLDDGEETSADDVAPGLQIGEKEDKETREPTKLDVANTSQMHLAMDENPVLAALPPERKKVIISRLQAVGDADISLEEASAILEDLLAKFGVNLGELTEEQKAEIQKFEDFVHTPGDNGDNSPDSTFAYTGDDNIAKAAAGMIGSTAFRGPEVNGGRLACAQFVTAVLKQTGYLDNVILGVDLTASTLIKKGWAKRSPTHTPKAGDVIIWNKTGSRVRDGYVAKGHGHIGIATGPRDCVSNSSNKATPRPHKIGNAPSDGYWNRRGIAMILTPPDRA